MGVNMNGIVIKGGVTFTHLPFWLGLGVEEYGCPGIGPHGIMLSLELGFVEFHLCIGKKYRE
jgi:hypothetical protein